MHKNDRIWYTQKCQLAKRGYKSRASREPSNCMCHTTWSINEHSIPWRLPPQSFPEPPSWLDPWICLEGLSWGDKDGYGSTGFQKTRHWTSGKNKSVPKLWRKIALKSASHSQNALYHHKKHRDMDHVEGHSNVSWVVLLFYTHSPLSSKSLVETWTSILTGRVSHPFHGFAAAKTCKDPVLATVG